MRAEEDMRKRRSRREVRVLSLPHCLIGQLLCGRGIGSTVPVFTVLLRIPIQRTRIACRDESFPGNFIEDAGVLAREIIDPVSGGAFAHEAARIALAQLP